MAQNLIHIVYVSFAKKALSEKQLQDLLKGIRKKNKEKGVTGLLLYNDGSFIQVIEGSEDTIKHLFEVITKDGRHNNIVKLLEEPIENRAFPDWYMGYRRLTKKQSTKLPGYSDFLNAENPADFLKGTTQQVIYLLDSFRKYS